MRDSLLGRAVSHFPKALAPALQVHCDNTGEGAIGLSQYYNACLDSCAPDDIALLVHDDVYIHSWFLADQIREAIACFDIVGLAGGANLDLRQPAWFASFDGDLRFAGPQEQARLSGCVGHGDPAAPAIRFYGATPASCELLDGLFIAVNVGRARSAGVRFDERFRFHCYDIDFCRSGLAAGLKIGTWPIAVTHASTGSLASAWREAARRYIEKWGTT